MRRRSQGSAELADIRVDLENGLRLGATVGTPKHQLDWWSRYWESSSGATTVRVLHVLHEVINDQHLPLCSAATEFSRCFQAVEEEMEVDHPRIWLPARHGARDRIVVERRRQPEPARQVVARPNVIAREDVQAPEPTQEFVLRAPASDPVQAHQP